MSFAKDPIRAALRKWLNPAFQGINWEGLLDSLTSADTKVINNIIATTEQLHYSTASGDYLSQWGADYNYPRPIDLGMSDEDFRKLLETIISNKLTVQSFLEVINIFYGNISTRANALSLPGPFLLNDGNDLKITFDGKRIVHVFFKNSDFNDITLATAAEVAAVINRYIEYYKYEDFATTYYDGASQQTLLQIYSASLGLGGFVQVTGGSAENGLLLPKPLYVPFSVPTVWTLAKYPTASQPNYLRMFTSTTIDYTSLQINDYINITGLEFNTANRGSFAIKTIADTYIEIRNLNGIAETVTQPNFAANFQDVLFYRPHKSTINDITSPAFAAQVSPKVTKVVLPAVSKNVVRNLETAAYLPVESTIDITSIIATAPGSGIGSLINITTATNHGLVTGNSVFLNNIFTGSINGLHKITNINSTSFSVTKSSLTPFDTLDMIPFTGTTLYRVGNGVVQNGYRWLVVTTGTTPASPSALPITPGIYTVPSTSMQVLFIGPYITPTVEPLSQLTPGVGPYTFDSDSGLGLTSTSSTITQAININNNFKSISISNSTSFPNSEGWVVLGYGQSYQSKPIHYLSTPSSTAILFDSNYTVTQNIPIGATITLLVSNGPYVPSNQTIKQGIAYITGDHLSRVYAQKTIDFIKGSGLDIDYVIQYPSSIGLANGSSPYSDSNKINDAVYVWGDDDLVNWKKAQDGNT